MSVIKKIFGGGGQSYTAPEPVKVDPIAVKVDGNDTAGTDLAEQEKKKKKRYGFATTVGSVVGNDTLGG